MTATRRFLSGSMAGWAGIAVVMLNQLALVPIFLAHWSVEEYGIWLTVQALLSFGTIFSFGYQTYLEFEFLKMGDQNRSAVARLLYSAIPVTMLLSAVEVAVIFALIKTGAIGALLSSGAEISGALAHDAGLLLLIMSVNSFVCISVPSLVQRALVPFGYYPRNAWWYVAGMLISTSVAAISVVLGANFLQAGIAQALAYMVFAIALCISLWKILSHEGLEPIKPDFPLGLRALVPSLALAVKTLFTMVQQQGIRVLLAGALGLRELASFASMRTVSNVALLGIGTVTNPLSPELIRFANSHESERLRATFGVMWLLVVALVGIILIILQWVAPWLFKIWTMGKIPFDPVTFAVLSVALLVYGLAQPLFVIVRGTNQLQAQLVATVTGASIVGASIYFLTNTLGLLGAALGILAAELAALVVYTKTAKLWIKNKGLPWPAEFFVLASVFALAGASGITAIANFPEYGALIVGTTCIAELCIFPRYWRALPVVIQAQISNVRNRLMLRFLKARND